MCGWHSAAFGQLTYTFFEQLDVTGGLRFEYDDRSMNRQRSDGVGGTWRRNTYPGCECDVPSALYSFSFETKSDWSKRYAPWHEIQQYILDTTHKYNLREKTLFNQEVDSAVFNEAIGKWVIKTMGGETIMARHWVLASGPLHVPAMPDIKGLDQFKGKVMHSAEWDHRYQLKGKKVAVEFGLVEHLRNRRAGEDVMELLKQQRPPVDGREGRGGIGRGSSGAPGALRRGIARHAHPVEVGRAGQGLGQVRLPQQALQAAVVPFLVGAAGGAAAMQLQIKLIPPHRQLGRQRLQAAQITPHAAVALRRGSLLMAPEVELLQHLQIGRAHV